MRKIFWTNNNLTRIELNILLTHNIIYLCKFSILIRLGLGLLPCLIERQQQSRSLESYSMENTIFPDLIVCQGKYCQSKNEHNTIETENKIINFKVFSVSMLISMSKHNICAVYMIYLVDMHETKHVPSTKNYWHFIVWHRGYLYLPPAII